MGVIIQDGRVSAAGVQFPLAEGDHFGTELGSRHRAAVGLSQEADALVIVVSEETGTISLAERGLLSRHLTPEQLRERLVRGLGRRRGFSPVAVAVAKPVKTAASPSST
jgi:diadenylate cyclase